MPREAASEPDALTMWFTRQRKAWWKKWRWVIITVISLRVLMLLAEFTVSGVLAFHTEISSASWFPSVRSFANIYYFSRPYCDYLSLVVALLLGCIESKAYIPLAEIALTQSSSTINKRLADLSKQLIWIWVLALYAVPSTVSCIVFTLMLENSRSSGITVISPLWSILTIFAVSLFVVEALALLLRRTVSVKSLTWQLLVPLLAIPIVELLSIVSWLIFTRTRLLANFEDHIAVAWLHVCTSAIISVVAIILANMQRKPPIGFTGTYET